MRHFFPLFAPDDATSATTTTTTSAGTNTPPAGDAAEIARLRAEAAEAAKLRTQLEATQTRIKTLFAPNADENARKAAVRQSLAESGWSAADIEAWEARQQGDGRGNQPKGKGRQQDDDDAEDDGQEDEPSEVQQLKERLARIEAQAQDSDREQTTHLLSNTIRDAVDGNKDFKAVLSRIQEHGTEDDRKFIKEVLPDIHEEVRVATLQEIRAKQTRTGLKPNKSWIPEASATAASKVLGKYTRLVSSASRIGSDSAMDDLNELLKVPEKKMPRPNDARPISEIERDMGEAMADKLLRDAAELSVGKRF